MGHAERSNPFRKWKGLQPGQTASADTRKAFDRHGREIAQDDMVYLMQKTDAIWRVQEVKPILNPGAPPGLIQLTLVSVVVTGVPGGQLLGDILKVVDAEEVKDQFKAVAPPQPRDGDGA